MDEYTAIIEISRTYSGVVFRAAGNVQQGEVFHAPYLAIQVAGGFLRSPAFHVHEIRTDGLVGQRVAVVKFQEARHVGA